MSEPPAVRPSAPIRGFSNRYLTLSPRYGTYLAIGGLPEQPPTAARGRQEAGKPDVHFVGASRPSINSSSPICDLVIFEATADGC